MYAMLADLAGSWFDPLLRLTLKRVKILIQPKRSAFKVFDENFEPKSYVPVAADKGKTSFYTQGSPFRHFFIAILIFINASVSKLLLFSGMKNTRFLFWNTPYIPRLKDSAKVSGW